MGKTSFQSGELLSALRLKGREDRPGAPTPWSPGQTLALGAVHELLFDAERGHEPPLYLAMLAAQSALAARNAPESRSAPRSRSALAARSASASASGGPRIVWFDLSGRVYPPALRLGGIVLDRVCLLRPGSAEAVWAAAECLRCAAVGAVVAALPGRLSQVEARRLQLSAERGGGIGLLLRPLNRADAYAAATRWLVAPAPAPRGAQRWSVEPLHGHGRRWDRPFILEIQRASAAEFAACLEPIPVHPSPPLVDRPAMAPPARTSA